MRGVSGRRLGVPSRRKDKGLRDTRAVSAKCPKDQVLTRGDSSRRETAEDVVEPAVVPVPLHVAPVQASDVQVAIRAAIDRAPEEDGPRPTMLVELPALRDEMNVLEKRVEDVRVERPGQVDLLAQTMTLDATHLLPLHEEELDLAVVDVQVVALAVDRHPSRSLVPLDRSTLEKGLRHGGEVDANGGVGDTLPQEGRPTTSMVDELHHVREDTLRTPLFRSASVLTQPGHVLRR